MWLNNFKIAIVQKDPDTIAKLLQTVPTFESVEEMKTAAFLCKDAVALLQDLQREQLRQKQQLKKNIDFLKSTLHQISAELDIKS